MVLAATVCPGQTPAAEVEMAIIRIQEVRDGRMVCRDSQDLVVLIPEAPTTPEDHESPLETVVRYFYAAIIGG